MFDALTRLPLRLLMRSLYALLRLRWLVTQPRTRGAHAIPLTPAGRIVLVRLRYVGGWRVPGGGIDPGEDPAQAALRELREEIGLTAHGAIQPALESEQRINSRQDRSAIFIVRDVAYAPSWSWEIEAITEAELDALPAGTSPRTRQWIQQARHLIGPDTRR